LLSLVLALPFQSGTITFDGQRIDKEPVDKNVRKGVCLVPEKSGRFASMTVMDNLLLGAHHNLQNKDKKPKAGFRMVPHTQSKEEQVAKTLSGGERQMLSCRGLMSAPKLILVDELR
jgi:branched-chain amino acid transport system ATP-binding protein